MIQRFQIDGLDYNVADLSEETRLLVSHLSFVTTKLNEMKNLIAILAKAKNAYIEDIKTEIIQERTGVDFSSLFSDG